MKVRLISASALIAAATLVGCAEHVPRLFQRRLWHGGATAARRAANPAACHRFDHRALASNTPRDRRRPWRHRRRGSRRARSPSAHRQRTAGPTPPRSRVAGGRAVAGNAIQTVCRASRFYDVHFRLRQRSNDGRHPEHLGASRMLLRSTSPAVAPACAEPPHRSSVISLFDGRPAGVPLWQLCGWTCNPYYAIAHPGAGRVAGTILPALPGLPLVFAGMLLGAWPGIRVHRGAGARGPRRAHGPVPRRRFLATALGAKRVGAAARRCGRGDRHLRRHLLRPRRPVRGPFLGALAGELLHGATSVAPPASASEPGWGVLSHGPQACAWPSP